MKAYLSRKTDNMGVLVGRLSAPNRVKFEDNGTIREFTLTGNVTDTEYNDVFILGKEIDSNTFEVQKMESLPIGDDKMFGLVGEGESGKLYALAIPEKQIDKIEEKISENGKPYTSLHAEIDRNTTIYIKVFGEFRKETGNACYVFILREAPTVEEKEFGQGYAVRKVKTKYAMANQLLS